MTQAATSRQTMKAMLYHGPGDIRYEDCPKPKPGKGEVLIKVIKALTGGTDVKTYLKGHPKLITQTPSAFGYEYAGVVEELGKDVNRLALGARVVTANTAPCGECFFCERAEFSLCQNLEFLNGSFAEYIKVPARIVERNLYQIPDGVEWNEACTTQTLAVALHGWRRSQPKPRDVVAVYGLGAIGQSFIKLAKLDGHKVIALGRSESKRKLATENGADVVIDLSPKSHCEQSEAISLRKQVIQQSQGLIPYGADIVIEAVGKPEAWSDAFSLARPGGLVNFFGGCPRGSTIELDTYSLHYDEIRTIGVFHHTPQYIKEAFELICSGKISMSNLITHEMPLARLETALEMMQNGEAIKVAIETHSQN